MAKIMKSKGSKFLTMGKLNLGMNALFSLGDYKDAREEGYSRLGSVAKAGATFATGELLGGWMIPFTLLPQIPKGIVSSIEGIGKLQRDMSRQSRLTPFNNSSFNDYNQAFTMRQAGMRLAENSRYNLQQTLMGNEAQMLKR